MGGVIRDKMCTFVKIQMYNPLNLLNMSLRWSEDLSQGSRCPILFRLKNGIIMKNEIVDENGLRKSSLCGKADML